MKNIGIIGIGYWGPNYMRIFNELPQSRVTYCCDIDQNKIRLIKEKYPNVNTTTKYQDLLEDPDVDAIVVSTSASTHYQPVKGCLIHGKDVLVEKPLTLSSKQCEDLIKISHEKNQILMVGHTFIYNPGVRWLKNYIDSGELGTIYYLYFSRTGLGPIRRDVNVLWDLAPHDLSILNYLIEGFPLQIKAAGESYLQPSVEDVVFLNLIYPNNILANVHVSWLDPQKIRRLTIVGSKRMIQFDDVNKFGTIKIFDKGIEMFGNKSYADYGEFQLSIRDGDIHIPKIPIEEPLKNQCVHFLECINSRKQPLTSGEDGLKVVKILETAQEKLTAQE
jgi:predicted dehydrogenase